MLELESKKYYSLQDVVNKKLIPWVTGYQTLYNLVTIFDNEGHRKYATKTTDTHILASVIQRPWAKRASKIFLRSESIAQFLDFHKLEYKIID